MKQLLRADKNRKTGHGLAFMPLSRLVHGPDCRVSGPDHSDTLNALKAKCLMMPVRQWHNTQISSPPSPAPNLSFLPHQSSHSRRPHRHGQHPWLGLLLVLQLQIRHQHFCFAELKFQSILLRRWSLLFSDPIKMEWTHVNGFFWDLKVGSRRGIREKEERRTVARSVNRSGEKVPFAIALSRRSVLHATRMTGIALPQIDLTSSIH